MHFFHSIWKNTHLTENFYKGTACGACDKYEVWFWMDVMVMFQEVTQQVVCIKLLGYWQQKTQIFKKPERLKVVIKEFRRGKAIKFLQTIIILRTLHNHMMCFYDIYSLCYSNES